MIEMGKKTNKFDVSGKIAATALRLLGQLPIGVAGNLGALAGHVMWALAAGPRNVTLKNIELCFPQMPEDERRALAKASIIETAVTAFEMAPAWVQPVDKLLSLITHADNETLLDQARKEGKGVVFIVPHFGNWELANYYMASHQPLVAMYKPGDSPSLNALILESRSKITEMVPADKKGVLSLFAALKEGKVTGVLPDQEPALKSGVWAPFFGIDALTPMLISRLVNKTGAVAIGFGCQRNADGKGYHVFYEPVDDEIYSDDINTSTAAMNRCVEQIILRDPTQYQWEYKRFKRRPNKAPNPY